jgi:hypothetical protein
MRAAMPIKAARVQAWAGQGRYTDVNPSAITGQEVGVQMRWFLNRDLSLDGSYARRSFTGLASAAGAPSADNYSVNAAYQILPQLNIAGRDGMGNIETATAIRQGLRFRSYGGGLICDPALYWKGTADYDVWRYNDSNTENNLRVGLQRMLVDWLSLGAVYLHEDTRFRSVSYYTPQDLNQYTGALIFNRPFGTPAERTGMRPGALMLRYEAGYGFEQNNSRAVQSVRGGLSWRFMDTLLFNVDAQYSVSPVYTSRQITGGLGITF